MTTTMLESYFIKTSFCLFIIGTVWHLFLHFKMNGPKRFFVIFSPSLKKFQNGPLKIKISKFDFDLDPKRYLEMGGGGMNKTYRVRTLMPKLGVYIADHAGFRG